MTVIDNYLSLHSNAVSLRTARAEVLAGNLANADTPGYRAKDIDFRRLLQNAGERPTGLTRTHSRHVAMTNHYAGAELIVRDSPQGSLDENTVDSEFERAQFADNDIRYHASIHFLNSRISGLIRAIRGE